MRRKESLQGQGGGKGLGEHGAVVAYAFEGAGVLRTDVLREVFDEFELTEF